MSKGRYVQWKTYFLFVITFPIFVVFLSCTENYSLDLSSIVSLIIFLWIFGSIIYAIARYIYTVFLSPYYFTKRQSKKQLRIATQNNDLALKQKNTLDLLWLDAIYYYERKRQSISWLDSRNQSSEINRKIRKSLSMKSTQEVKVSVHLNDNEDLVKEFNSIIWNKLLVLLPDKVNPIVITDECLPVPKEFALKLAKEKGYDLSVIKAGIKKEFPEYKFRDYLFYKNIALYFIPLLHFLSFTVLLGLLGLTVFVVFKLDVNTWIKVSIFFVLYLLGVNFLDNLFRFIDSFFKKLKHKYAFKNFGLNGRSLKLLGRNSLISFDHKKTSFVTKQPIIIEISDSSVEISEFFYKSYKIHHSEFIYPSETKLFFEDEKSFLRLDLLKKELNICGYDSSLNYLHIQNFEIISFR